MNHVLLVTGVRADESPQRQKLAEYGYDYGLNASVWRPILRWTLADVLACLKRHNVPMNPLYGRGAQRVGCYPCINSNKKEIAMIARNDPQRIEFLKGKEEELGRTFFTPNKTPTRYHTHQWRSPKTGELHSLVGIGGVVQWALNGENQSGAFDFGEDDSDLYACSASSGVQCE